MVTPIKTGSRDRPPCFVAQHFAAPTRQWSQLTSPTSIRIVLTFREWLRNDIQPAPPVAPFKHRQSVTLDLEQLRPFVALLAAEARHRDKPTARPHGVDPRGADGLQPFDGEKVQTHRSAVAKMATQLLDVLRHLGRGLDVLMPNSFFLGGDELGCAVKGNFFPFALVSAAIAPLPQIPNPQVGEFLSVLV